ncbi:squalene/phytoene synthase family protein, partial [Blastomonas sp.]|uniref:squalene/phytoene synthase family protein n=1 Tax=Blastomonas sp. TaxID=1909299 RepID=UPI0035940545
MDPDLLPQPQRLALLYAPPGMRPAVGCLFELDERLGRIVATAREPMLAQMRMVWWRDRLGEARDMRPKGDPVLDAVGSYWPGEEAALIALVDGWEELLGQAPLSENAFRQFAEGKGAAFAAVARLAGQASYAEAAHDAGCRFAL